MDSSKLGVMECFEQDVEALWGEHTLTFSHHVEDACHLWGAYFMQYSRRGSCCRG